MRIPLPVVCNDVVPEGRLVVLVVVGGVFVVKGAALGKVRIVLSPGVAPVRGCVGVRVMRGALHFGLGAEGPSAGRSLRAIRVRW